MIVLINRVQSLIKLVADVSVVFGINELCLIARERRKGKRERNKMFTMIFDYFDTKARFPFDI